MISHLISPLHLPTLDAHPWERDASRYAPGAGRAHRAVQEAPPWTLTGQEVKQAVHIAFYSMCSCNVSGGKDLRASCTTSSLRGDERRDEMSYMDI